MKRAPAPLAVAGLYLLTGGVPSQWNRGDMLVFICAVWFALYIMVPGYYATRLDTLSPATWQLGVVAVLSLVFSLGTGSFTLSLPMPVWGAVGVTAIFCSVFAYAVQTHVQRFTPPFRTALILTAEPVFGAFPTHGYGGEALLEQPWLSGGLFY